MVNLDYFLVLKGRAAVLKFVIIGFLNGVVFFVICLRMCFLFIIKNWSVYELFIVVGM